jgi:hypothetical protein
MKMTLEKLRNMDESELADADHPFKKDITAEEFVEILNEIAKESIKVKALSPLSEEDWSLTQEAILKAMNSPKNSC